MDDEATEFFLDILESSTEIFYDYFTEDNSNFDSIATEIAGWQYNPNTAKFFPHIPEWQHICAIWSIFIVGWILNLLVIKVYSGLKSGNSVYVLAMAVIDLCFLSFALLPRFFMLFLKDGFILQLVSLCRFLAVIFLMTQYMLMPLFLALDRFVAVKYPLSKKYIHKKLRPVKIGLILSNVLLCVMTAVGEILQLNSRRFVVAILIVLFATEVLTSLGLYVVIAFKLMMARRKMSDQRHVQTSNRYTCTCTVSSLASAPEALSWRV